MEREIIEYNVETENLFIEYMLSNPELYARCANILKDDYFDDKTNRNTIKTIATHFTQYSSIPTIDQIKSQTNREYTLRVQEAIKEDRWFLTEIEYFCKYKALKDAILSSPELLDEGRYGEVETMVKSAVQIALVQDLGTDYYHDPKSRLEAVKEGNGQLSTGWKTVDEKLYGGLNKGELVIFAGQCVTADTKVMAVKVIDLYEYNKEYSAVKHTIQQIEPRIEEIKYLSQFYSIEKIEHLGNHYDHRILNKLYIDMQPKEYNILDLHDTKDKWFVDSPDGLVQVDRLISKGTYDIIRTEFTDGTYINSSGLHCFENMNNGWIAPINLTKGHTLKAKNGSKTVSNVINTGEKDLVFDLVVNSDNHRYYTNNISSHNSGAGKSLFLQNLAVNWSMAGLNVVYLSLELSEKLCAMRVDAMHTGYGTREVLKNIDDVALKLRTSQMKTKGNLQIKQLPNGCTANDVRAYIKEYEIHKNLKVDCVLVDYLDLMMPVSKKISAENLFVKDKYVTEELRNLAVELQLVTVSASQLNRCVAPDTKVEIEGKGLIDIKDVNVGDRILSHTGYNTVLDKWNNQKQHVYKIILLSGKYITCSMYHRFPTYKGLNTLENGLAVGDYLLVEGVNTILNREPITKVEYIGEIETIDITTDRDHMFYGNGILTHNTSYEEIEFDPSHIAGGISKVNTADNVIGIFTSAAMKESGRYQIQFMKTRSSSGVGSKVDLAFCNKSLRISDLDEADEGAVQSASKDIYEKLKKKGTITKETVDPDTGEIVNKPRTVNPVEGAKSVRDFLKSRK